METAITRIILLLVVAASAQGQEDRSKLDIIPQRVLVPSNLVCGTLIDAVSARPLSNKRLELKPVSYKFAKPRISIVQVRVGKTVKRNDSGKDGDFDLRGVKPGIYKVRIDTSAEGAWGELEILPRSGDNACHLRIILDLNASTVEVRQQ